MTRRISTFSAEAATSGLAAGDEVAVRSEWRSVETVMGIDAALRCGWRRSTTAPACARLTIRMGPKPMSG
jgi:uncharacterized protein (DUF3084 family)